MKENSSYEKNLKRLKYAFLFFMLLNNFALFTIIILSSHAIWLVELLSYSVPFLLATNLLLFIVAIFFIRNRYYIGIILIIHIASWDSINETFATNLTFSSRDNYDFSVISYNADKFGSTVNGINTSIADDETFFNWLRNNSSPDILCIQEFFHGFSDDIFNTLDSIVHIGNYRYYYMNPIYRADYEGIVGVVTFSKFKCINSGQIKYNESDFNKGIYTDFLINGDTVRVLNFQLNSMSIRWGNTDTLKDSKSRKLKTIYHKLKEGFHIRKKEIAEIERSLENYSNKVIICADLNSTSHGYTYQKLKNKYNNAFEDASFGFGHTYNKFPWFIRIDHQFYDKRLKVKYFKTHSNIYFSDHFPIEARYTFGKN